MLQVIYSSAAVVPFSEVELTKLLAVARVNNEHIDVTGMLLYHEGSFLQVLEGRERDLEALYEKISHDDRHHRIVTLLRRTVTERHFGAWRMGFASASRLPKNMPGYADYLRLSGDALEGGNAASRLLAAFREGRFRSYVQG
jgi:Sensors of blue-light using FAD